MKKYLDVMSESPISCLPRESIKVLRALEVYETMIDNRFEVMKQALTGELPGAGELSGTSVKTIHTDDDYGDLK